MTMTGLASVWDDYLVVVREDAHQLLAWSYADTRPRLATARDEYEMTGLLADGMEARINCSETDYRYTRYAIHNEKPTSPSGQLGKTRPRLDIQIELCGVRPKPHFTFEAKRLRDDANSGIRDTMRHYLGDEGICRFVNGHYSPESSEAAMLGLIQAHDSAFWMAHVGHAFASEDSNRGPKAFGLIAALQPANVIPEFPDEHVSVHARPSGSEIRIFHLFIDCR